jgi:hypothetical protein
MIPENKKNAVEKALQMAFGVNAFQDIHQLEKGLSSALIFKITVHRVPYLLRVITRTDPMADPGFYFNCMQMADQAGLAPHIHYLSIEDRVSITDFIHEQPFPIPEARRKMAGLLQQLHALPKFPYRINYFDAMEGFITKLRSANILPDSVTKGIFEEYEKIAKGYPRNDKENWVSCHNDLKPENIIFDGRKPWPVDWEAAFLNDRYMDLSVVGNFVLRDEDNETEYLEAYFGETVNEYRRARFFLMRQMLHTYYFTLFILSAAAGKAIDPKKIGDTDFRTFHDRIWQGEIDLADTDAKLQYAWVHMKQALRNAKERRVEHSLRIVSKYRLIH